MNAPKKQRPIAITGMGIVSSLGKGIPAFREALFHGQSCFTRSSSYPLLSFPVIGAFIQDFNFSHALETFSVFTNEQQKTLQKLARSLSLPIQIALIAAIEAWQQAFATQCPFNAERVSLIVAAQNTTTHYQYNLYQTFQQQPDYFNPTYALQFMDSHYVGVLSEAFGILGEGFTVGGASASGNVALLRAYQLIQNKSQDACLVVGALADLSPMELQGFHNLGALGGHSYAQEPNKACRPFDEAHEGFIYGQAAACLLLESLSSARKRQVPILGYILGGALLLDGNHLSNPSREGELRVMQKAIKLSGITVKDINYINTHGTSSPLGDEIEIEAIQALFGTDRYDIMINSTKSITGHCLWSAGIVEAIATIIQIQEKFVHPTLNLERPVTKYGHFVTKKSESLQIQAALSNGFGFGGINTAVVFSK